MPLTILSLTCTQLADELRKRYGKGQYHAAAIYREVYKKGNTRFAKVPEFARSPALGARIAADLRVPAFTIACARGEGATKFASTLGDGTVIESVIIPGKGRTTLCVSSQAGCRMGCAFCATGALGFGRNLSAEEIVWQVYAARFEMKSPVDNVVFMGMGEPLDNPDNVAQAVAVMHDQRGLDIAHSNITISTCGHVLGLRRLAALKLFKLRLAVSLNAANDALRSALMPVNRRYPLGRLKAELAAFPLPRDGVIFFEYVLLAGVNDSREHAVEVAAYVKGLKARVNVIAYNAAGSTRFTSPSVKQVQRFCKWLHDEGVFVRLRQSRGQSIFAACGQLAAR